MLKRTGVHGGSTFARLFLSLHSDRNMKRVPCHAGLLHSYANALNVSERKSSITGGL